MAKSAVPGSVSSRETRSARREWRPPELARDAGRWLRLRRYWTYDLVPRRAGRLELAEIRVPYFDPGTRRFAEAVLEPIAIDVAAAPPDPAQRPRVEVAAEDAPGTPRGGPGWPAATAALGSVTSSGVRYSRLRKSAFLGRPDGTLRFTSL